MVSIGINNLIPTIWVDESFLSMLTATILEFVRLHGLFHVYGVWNTLRHLACRCILNDFYFYLAKNCLDSYWKLDSVELYEIVVLDITQAKTLKNIYNFMSHPFIFFSSEPVMACYGLSWRMVQRGVRCVIYFF